MVPELNTEEINSFYKHYKTSGSKNKKCIFTEQEIINIREAYYVDLISVKDISDLYACHETTISRIVSNKSYSDVPMPEPSLEFKRKNHIFEESEIDDFINLFI